MTKKERVTAAIRGEEVDKIPSGFSLHFPKESAFGDAAVKAAVWRIALWASAPPEILSGDGHGYH